MLPRVAPARRVPRKECVVSIVPRREDTPMRIAVDCSPLSVPHSAGIARVVRQTLAALEARGRIEIVRAQPTPGESLRRWRLRTWPAQLRAGYRSETGPMAGVQGVQTFQAAFPLRVPQPCVPTLHELSWKHGVREPGQWRRKGWCALARWRAAAIVTATQHSAHDLGIPLAEGGGRLHVIPWAPAPVFQPRVAADADEALLRSHGLQPGSYWLAPGGLRPKKRPERWLAALRDWPPSAGPCPTVVWTQTSFDASPATPLPAEFASLPQITLTDATDEELAAWMRHACAVVMLSPSEGFGLPVLEALACGTCVVVPPHSAQAEVAGNAGIVAASSATEDLLQALLRAHNGEGPDRSARLARAAAFSWERTAQGFEAMWETLL